jgi:hypothetical protein
MEKCEVSVEQLFVSLYVMLKISNIQRSLLFIYIILVKYMRSVLFRQGAHIAIRNLIGYFLRLKVDKRSWVLIAL